MAFLDNSGDIILDAVLTDTGRKLLARGDGSFRVTKFAFGDDEINYELYDSAHASGSAYYDLNILQSPVLEAFTNNTSSMKSKLITLSNNSLRYLPVVQLNTKRIDGPASVGALVAGATGTSFFSGSAGTGGTYVVLADENSLSLFTPATQLVIGTTEMGTFAAYGGTTQGDTYQTSKNPALVLDQGINNTGEGTTELPIGNSLYETQYLVEVDNRFFTLMTPSGDAISTPRSFVDDDNVASYFFAIQDAARDMGPRQYFGEIRHNANGSPDSENTAIAGRTGSRLQFRLRVTEEVERSTGGSNYLFTTFGGASATTGGASAAFRTINTNIRITGMTTGYRVSVPIQLIKKEA